MISLSTFYILQWSSRGLGREEEAEEEEEKDEKEEEEEGTVNGRPKRRTLTQARAPVRASQLAES